MKGKQIVVFGGSGFLGRNLLQKLAKKGAIVKVGVRHENSALFLRTMGEVGQITPVSINVQHPGAVTQLCQGADYIINLTGILYEKGSQTFQGVHVTGAENIAKAARKVKAKRLIHISAIGADPKSLSTYATTKGLGEKAVLKAFPDATILRPSIIFGPDDQFFNRFASLAQFSPFLPAFGGGENKMQPVFVGDVSDGIINTLLDSKTKGNTYELGGPKVYTFKNLMEITFETIQRKKTLLSLPYGVGSFLGQFLKYLPTPPLTPDQVKLLRVDNVVHEKAKGFKELKIKPRALEALIPTYLHRYRPHF